MICVKIRDVDPNPQEQFCLDPHPDQQVTLCGSTSLLGSIRIRSVVSDPGSKSGKIDQFTTLILLLVFLPVASGCCCLMI